MRNFARYSALLPMAALCMAMAACGGGSSSSNQLTTPTVTVAPATSSIDTAQSLNVVITVSGYGGTATGSIVLSSGSYSSAATALTDGSVTIKIPAGMLTVGSDTLMATYTPDSSSSSIFNSASGSGSVTVTALPLLNPSVTVTPAYSSITTAQSLSVTIAVSGSGGTPTGSVVLSSGSYTSVATTLSSGSASIIIPAGKLAAGTDTLNATYTPDSTSSSIYNSGSGTNSVTVDALITPTVKVTPGASSITTAQTLQVTIAVTSTSGTPTGSVVLSSGSYASAATTLSSGSASITIPANSLSAGTDTLTAAYTPDSSSSATYNSASGNNSVTVTPLLTPTVKVTPGASSITTAQTLQVTIAVTGSGATPTGSVVLSSGSYTSSAATLSSGSASITIPAGKLATGTDTLSAAFTPDSASSSIYNSASGNNSVTVTTAPTAVAVTIDVLSGRHTISPYIYGGANPEDAAAVGDSKLSMVRWGGNGASTYNWQLGTYNADNDYYWEDFGFGGFSSSGGSDSVQWITDVEAVGSHPLMTMVMLPWVAQSAENGSNGHWSFSVGTWGAQCAVDPYNHDAGDGLEADCSTPVTTNAVTTAYYPLVDTAADCPSGTTDGSTCLDRQTWTGALTTAFGSGTCTVPGSAITSCHFYDMDNEVDIWGGTHRDIHPAASGYDELANTYTAEAAKLKSWDPEAVRFGPVSCCWWYYWSGANGNDKDAHGGVDFLPWWLNQVNWLDQINGARTLDVFDIHAYPDANTSGLTTAQTQALAADVYRDYWDPTYVSTSGTINQQWTTKIQPKQTIPFRIPRMRALVNAIYPGTPLAFTEWSAAFAGESDFSTALGDAQAYGIFGRERLSFASRWSAPTSNSTTTGVPNPNYLALKLYTNYDGASHSFGSTSVSDTATGGTALFSSYAALNASGTELTIMVVNKDPANSDLVTFDLTGFNATTYTAYTLASTTPTAISTSATKGWTSSQSFAPYSITLLVINGTLSSTPASEWDLNPDTIMVPSSGTTILKPQLTSGTAAVTLSSAVFDAYEGAPACLGSIALTTPTINVGAPGKITVTAGSEAGFCHFTVTGSDGTVTQTKGGWIVVGNPPATLAASGGNNQSGTHGTALTTPLAVTLTPGASGGVETGAGILFTTSAGTLSNGSTSGTSVIATTNSSGIASVTLTLPAAVGTVTVQAKDQFALGGATTSFTETAQ
ncbi:MAG: glycoside hydrolase family 44 protein [Terracidiphilus sp.]